ncbi:tripartite tricarboxylate transporter TctB family protein [Halobacterium noricense]|uniref:tripartite tricarboxylate transporter TctB family protein n=1 Tax=Halobacterium noricense TaxID=223182 RepID=UPI001E2B34FE|nr:tripartite tricarboxylate transporter TctB family protein [Halobacterium noricense]UHH24018.1 tripartite tricarboxylate transporter TctB family protein [Halobacterium noricense]
MTVQELYQHLVEDVIDPEKALLTVMTIMSGYMLWGTTQFDITSAARFPRLTASVVFIGSILLLAREYLPDPIEQAIVSEGAAFEADEEFTERKEEMEEEIAAEAEGGVSAVDRPIHDSMFTALAVIGYALMGYAIGLLWATPLFVITYARWFRIDPLRTVVLAVIGFAIAYSFMVVLNVPIDAGKVVLTGGAPWLP